MKTEFERIMEQIVMQCNLLQVAKSVSEKMEVLERIKTLNSQIIELSKRPTGRD